MFATFLQETFRRFGGQPMDLEQQSQLTQAVEHVVDETYGRLRLIPGYAQRLREPVQNTFRHIDALVEAIPEAVLCCRDTFVSDPRVNAFFATPAHVREVFSHSREVRDLFQERPDADECWALLCMHKEEHSQLGMELSGDAVRREVMQTGVSFTDHQVLSPGATEEDARQALKCCIFDSLLAYMRRKAGHAKENLLDLEHRRRILQGRMRSSSDLDELQRQIDEIDTSLAGVDLRLMTLEDHLIFIEGVLQQPELYVSRQDGSLRLDRMGIRRNDGSGQELYLTEIHVACHGPRIAALVRFPRKELLPQQDYLKQADLFLAQ